MRFGRRGGSGSARIEREQCLAVDLAVGRERDVLDRDDARRQHEARQAGLERPAKLVGADALTGARGHDEGNERVCDARGRERAVGRDGEHHGSRDAGQRSEHALDLCGLDPVAAHLDLLVDAAEELERAVGQPARTITRAVEPRTRLGGERVGHEPLRRERGLVEIAPADLDAADAELAGHADGHGLELRVQDVGARVGHGPADRHRARAVPGGVASPGRHGDRGLGRTVRVVQLARHLLEERPHQLG